MTRRECLPSEDEYARLIEHAVGTVWLCFIGGAITMKDAERLDPALRQAAWRAPVLPEWASYGSATRH